jgi:ribosome biogenesis protein Tsr3
MMIKSTLCGKKLDAESQLFFFTRQRQVHRKMPSLCYQHLFTTNKNLILDSTAFSPVSSSDRTSAPRLGFLVLDDLWQSVVKKAKSFEKRKIVSDCSETDQ